MSSFLPSVWVFHRASLTPRFNLHDQLRRSAADGYGWVSDGRTRKELLKCTNGELQKPVIRTTDTRLYNVDIETLYV